MKLIFAWGLCAECSASKAAMSLQSSPFVQTLVSKELNTNLKKKRKEIRKQKMLLKPRKENSMMLAHLVEVLKQSQKKIRKRKRRAKKARTRMVLKHLRDHSLLTCYLTITEDLSWRKNTQVIRISFKFCSPYFARGLKNDWWWVEQTHCWLEKGRY